MNELFFELIRLSVGTGSGMSRNLSAKEWKKLFNMADRQSIAGVCFAGVQCLANPDFEDYCGMSELQYLTWMGVAAQIQQKNELVNSQCVHLQKMLAADGLRSCILKGQGVALSYPESLRCMRQSGDIDVWVDAPRDVILTWAHAHGETDGAGDLHVECDLFPETSVELHFKPSVISGRKRNRMLQEWFESQKDACMTNKLGGFIVPTPEFNMVYLMQHMFRHYLYEGIGLRHVMDYYMALQAERMVVQQSTKNLVRLFGMEKFAGALMWVMQQVFGGNTALELPWKPDEKRGRRLLEVIMEGGNFGHSTMKYKVTGWDKPWSRLSRYVRRNWFMLWDYPDEIIRNILKKIMISLCQETKRNH